MSLVDVSFSKLIHQTNLDSNAVLVVGKHEHIKAANLELLETTFGGKFDMQHFMNGFNQLSEKSSDSIQLWMKNYTLATLPAVASRHNAPMVPHALSSLVTVHTGKAEKEFVVIICPRVHAFALGCAIPRVFPLYNDKTGSAGKVKQIVVAFLFVGENTSDLNDDELNLLTYAGESIRLTARIVDAPCNKMHTNIFLDEVRKVSQETHAHCTIIQGEELNEKGFGGIYGVGKAAVNQPALAILSYKPEGATKNVAWCGKGIVYDTGGLSIKTKTGMPGMKRDCGGAAGVLGAFRAAVKAGFKENLFAVLCLAENAVGPKSARPDDVHTLYSGLTVEINNTDAEGRLVLGDGVAYAKKDLKADIIVDMATLTGAQGISTGQYHAAILTNNEEWEQSCMQAGKMSGDLVFPIPYCPELHFEEFDSVVADMKNSVKNRMNAQCSCAGLFIGSHIGFDFPGVWLHIDMAYPVEFQLSRRRRH